MILHSKLSDMQYLSFSCQEYQTPLEIGLFFTVVRYLLARKVVYY